MQLVKKDYAVYFETRVGELTITRAEYEALREVFSRREFELPEWETILTWNETRQVPS